MCGFVGYVNKEGNKEEIIKKMTNVIAHRGPDDESFYIDQDIAMGFRRLSIIDIKNGRQPMTNEEDTLIITFNGEIYNAKEIREDLLEKGHKFKNNSDTEVILHGYEEYKEKILDKLRGMFAFVIWDNVNKELFGARDIFGIKPFYYSKIEDSLFYGSEIKSFLPNKKFVKELNKEALKTYLTFQYSALDETFFKNVYRLKQGHYLRYKVEKEELEIKPYYEINFSSSKESFNDMLKQLEENVTSSVDYHEISDVEVGSFLSSGVDSSYIVSYAKPDKTYSVGFNNKGFDETIYARELSNILEIENKSKIITADEFFDSLEAVQYHSDEPHANLSAVPLYHLSKFAAKDVKVVLSGEGADELFGGYQEYYSTNIHDFYCKLPLKVRKNIAKISNIIPIRKVQRFLNGASKTVEEKYIGQAFIFNNEEANDVLTNEYKTDIKYTDITAPIFEKVKEENDLVKMQYLDMNLWLPNDILLKADKMTMAHSLELRVPFLDKEVWEFASKIPKKYKIGKKQMTKIILRKAALKIIPKDWAKRKKIGFLVPFSTWIKDEKYYNKVKEVFESEYTKEFFDQEQIIELLNKHYEEKEKTHRKIYTIYAFLIWYKKYFIEMK